MSIVYLLGAGASANALPLAADIPSRLNVFLDFLVILRSFNEDVLRRQFLQNTIESQDSYNKLWSALPFGSSPSSEADDFISDLEKLIRLLVQKKSKTIDTFAKELWLRGEFGRSLFPYQRLKAIFRSYMIFEESLSGSEIITNLGNKASSFRPETSKLFKDEKFKNKDRIDQRYINFLLDIADGNLSKIQILSWNYDEQIKEAAKSIGMHTGHTPIATLLQREIKINGSIAQPEIGFSWENNVVDAFQQCNFTDTKHIIIIGYSLPFSNRKIDQLIFNKIASSSKEPNIVVTIQTLNEDDFKIQRQALESIIESIQKHPFLPEKGNRFRFNFQSAESNSFFIPYDY